MPRKTPILIAALAALLIPLHFGMAYEVDTDERVVAFGDVHGAYDDLAALLQEVGVVDAELNWAGGRTHLVSLGDLVDRGPGSRQVVELMMKLQGQAEAAGGAVHMVLGNHEIMVMIGDLRYVSAPEFAAFADDESAAERDAAFAGYRALDPERDEAALRDEFDARFPSGFFALRRAYSPQGALGAWLLQQPFAIRVNERVYMHAGVSAAMADKSLEALNEEMAAELRLFIDSMEALRAAGQMPWFVSYDDRLAFLNQRAEVFAAANPGVRADWFDPLTAVFESQTAVIFGPDSPTWYRGTAMCHPYSESFNTERFLNNVGAAQLVIGHTPTRGDVHSRMDGLIIRLDTGMLSSVYGGRAAALISEGGRDYVRYLGDESIARPIEETRDLAQSLSGMSDAELENFMRTAPVVDIADIGTGITKPKRVTQEMEGIRNDAVFKYEDTHPGLQDQSRFVPRRHNDADRYVYDVAAYKLDRLLDLQMVPTSVIAEIDGDEGALSDWVENAVNERDRLEEEIPFGGYCDQWEQYRLRFVFDILIYNEDRNLTNILWSSDDFMLRFIDHSLAFRSTEKRPKQYRKVDVEISDLLRRRLESLDQDALQSALGDYLHPRQVEAIISRRDLLLEEGVRP